MKANTIEKISQIKFETDYYRNKSVVIETNKGTFKFHAFPYGREYELCIDEYKMRESTFCNQIGFFETDIKYDKNATNLNDLRTKILNFINNLYN